MPVAVPEKTLEHWVSIYLSNKFSSKISLWWTAFDKDILIHNIPNLPRYPGKAVSIELKTVTPDVNNNYQEVSIDICQLHKYHSGSGPAPYYIFPRPWWDGDLVTATKNLNMSVSRSWLLPPAELAFKRSKNQVPPSVKHPVWFADWMVVLSTEEVFSILGGYPQKKNGRHNKVPLVRWYQKKPPNSPQTNPPYSIWDPSGAKSQTIPPLKEFRSLWDMLLDCGNADSPQAFQINKKDFSANLTYDKIKDLLRSYADREREKAAEFRRIKDNSHEYFREIMPDNHEVIPDFVDYVPKPEDTVWVTSDGKLIEESTELAREPVSDDPDDRSTSQALVYLRYDALFPVIKPEKNE